jgi:hypothetical protein
VKQNSSNQNRIFELEDDGTILHCSPESTQAAGADVGANFFDSGDNMLDMSELRRHFKNFVRSHKAVDRFTLRCSAGRRSFDARVQLTRAFRTAYSDPTGVVMLEIRTS